ncbi:hypothetical protein DNTS_014541 [Danionella cerebrum]|uniref:Chemokine interleukin-8-like domain-containing protein n=1 Tax=Danionella cerebrum TaxID=2873325 RepID=A0A553RLU3_9TELE|nr:hypothetical protein DNTS_014541 [Danionella translucida]
MEFRSTSLLLLVCVSLVILTSTKGKIQPCCLAVSRGIPHWKLHQVVAYEIQRQSGHCEIDAVILYMKKRKICIRFSLELLEKLNRNGKPVLK